MQYSPNQSVLFFSRGKGRGHAIPDVALLEDLLQSAPDLDVRFVSYSTGAITIRELGHDVIDLGLPEDNSLVETIIQALHLISDIQPRFVISHEELAALPSAKAFQLPTILLTDWLPLPNSVRMECLNYADEVIFIDEPGHFDVPPFLRSKIIYTGPVLRRFGHPLQNKAQARARFGFPEHGIVISVIPGGSLESSESKSPILAGVLAAFEKIPFKEKILAWIAHPGDNEFVKEYQRVSPTIQILEPRTDIETLMIASDLGITKANRITTLEFWALGVPSISISHGLNPIDDWRVAHIPTNRALRAGCVTPSLLADLLTTSIQQVASRSHQLVNNAGLGRQNAAKRILQHLRT